MKTKALSIKQPWAGLIAAQIKPVENRGWVSKYTPGPLAICASKVPEPKYVFEMVREKLAALGLEYPAKLCSINGQCIATTNVVGVVTMKKGKPSVKEYGCGILPNVKDVLTWWVRDQYGWLLNNTKTVEPFPVSGRLMLYQIELPDEGSL